jgi:hypothetical protein
MPHAIGAPDDASRQQRADDAGDGAEQQGDRAVAETFGREVCLRVPHATLAPEDCTWLKALYGASMSAFFAG